MASTALNHYKGVRFFDGLLRSALWTMAMPFFIQIVKLPPEQQILMGTIYEVCILICEVPTGVVADLVSRKLSLAIGYFLVGAGFLLQGLMPFLIPVIIAQMVIGVGDTFTSGAREAWIADELPHSDTPHVSAAEAFLGGSRAELVGRLAGTWLGYLIALAGLAMVQSLAGLLTMVLGIATFVVLKEQGFNRSDSERGMWKQFRTGWSIVRNSRVLIAILIVTVFFGLASEGFDRLSTQHILNSFTLPKIAGFQQEIWWSIIGSAAIIGTLAVNHWIDRNVDLNSEKAIRRTLVICTFAAALLVIGFSLLTNFTLGIGCYILGRTLRRAISPLMTALINLRAPSQSRATVLSFEGQAHSFGEIFAGPSMAAVARWISVRAAILASGVLLIPPAGLLAANPKVEPAE